MPDLTVDTDSRLDAFLLRNKVLPWRVPILAANGGVLAFRGKGKKSLTLTGGATPLKTGDLVRIVDPIPTLCAQALQKEADNNWRDYAIVPGSTPPGTKPGVRVPGTTKYDDLMLAFMQLRTRTVVIQNQTMLALDDFLNGLATCKDIIFPIRHLIVVGHASYSGSFHIRITGLPYAQASVRYEDLEYALAHKLIIMDLSLMMPRPKGEAGPQLRLLGCSVGGQVPFMKKFKEALGNQITLIAPTRILFPDTMRSPPGQLAYMGYNFLVTSPTVVKDQAMLIGLMKANSQQSAFLLENGKPVPGALWKTWVPKYPNTSPFSRLSKQLLPEPLRIPNPVNFPILGTKGISFRRFAYNDQFRLPDTQIPAIPQPVNATSADWIKAVKAWLQKNDPRYSNTHPFPFFVRMGYTTIDDFMNGWDWQFLYDKSSGTLTCDPVRYEYRLWQPIVAVATNELIMNYYPKDINKVPNNFRPMMPIVQLNVSDARFFGVY